MIISLCLPNMNRTHDLKVSLPAMIKAAQASPPVEISLINYNSKDDLEEWIKTVEIPEDVIFSYRKYTGREYYHMAHARNLSVVNSKGDYIAIASADMIPHEDYFKIVRELIETHGYTWMGDMDMQGFIVCKKDEFMAAGGYDERFEFYGPEDKELNLRLFRRGGKFGPIPRGHIDRIRTPWGDRYAHYRPGLSREEIAREMNLVAGKSFVQFTLEANRGKPWGQWDEKSNAQN